MSESIKHGWYSQKYLDESTHKLLRYATPNGGEVLVCFVGTLSNRHTIKWDDLQDLGPVTKYLGQDG